LAALTIEVVARSVMEVRMREILEFRLEDAGESVEVRGAGWSCDPLYRSDSVGIEDIWMGEGMADGG